MGNVRCCRALLVAGMACTAHGQEPAETETVTDVGIVCDARGEEKPRLRRGDEAADPVDRAAFYLAGHRVRWELHPFSVRSVDKLTRLLGASEKTPLLLKPGPGTCVADIVITWDAAVACGFTEVRIAGAPGLSVSLRAVDPDDTRPALLPAHAEHQLVRADDWRPTIRVFQSGAMESEGQVLRGPSEDGEDGERTEQAIELLMKQPRCRALWKGQEVDGKQIETVETPLLVFADRWVEWRHVQDILSVCATKRCFRAVEIAVCGEDLEMKLVMRRR